MGICTSKKKEFEDPVEIPDLNWDGVYDYQDQYVPFDNLPDDIRSHIKSFLFEYPGYKRFNLH